MLAAVLVSELVVETMVVSEDVVVLLEPVVDAVVDTYAIAEDG